MRILVFFFCMATSLVSWGQSMAFHRYSVSDGLPSSEVYQIYQDEEGFIWFATDNGVAKFDGKEMQTFHVNEGLKDPVTFGFCVDRLGKLWFRTNSDNIFYYENNKIHSYRYNNLLKDGGLIRSMYFDKNNELWLGTTTMLDKIHSDGCVDKLYLGDYDFQLRKIDNHYISYSKGPPNRIRKVTINDKPFRLHLSDTITKNLVICSLQYKGKLYFSMVKDVFEFDGKEVKRIFSGKAPIISFSKDELNILWIGYLNYGLEGFKNERFVNPIRLDTLNDKSVTTVLRDNKKGLWISTLESGVYYFPNQSILEYPLNIKSKIKSVVKLNENVVTGDYSGKIHVFDNQSKKIIAKKQLNGPVLSMLANTKGDLWVATTSGLNVLDSSLLIRRHEPPFSCLDMHEDKNGDIWGLSSSDVFKFNRKGDLLFQRKSFNHLMRTLSFVGSNYRISETFGFRLYDSCMNMLSSIRELDNFKISKCVSLNDSVLCVATTGSGLLVLHGKSAFKQYDFKDRLLADNVYDIAQVGSNIWLATENGIAITDKLMLLKGEPEFHFFNKGNGLRINKINSLLPIRSLVWAFFDEGFYVIPDSLPSLEKDSPGFYIRRVLVNDIQFPIQKDINSSYDQNNIRIDFGFISFRDQRIFIRYRMGIDDPWIYIKDRRLEFYSLSPGKYLIDLEFSTDNNIWQCATQLPRIFINPPWWQTLYFQVGIFLIAIALTYLFFKDQFNTYKQRHRYLKLLNTHQQSLIQSEIETIENERTRIGKDLHDSIGSNLNVMKMTVNQMLIRYNEPKTIQIEEQFQGIIQEIKNIIYDLVPPGLERYGLIMSLQDYVEKCEVASGIRINFSPFGKDGVNKKQSVLIFRVLQELLLNSINHSKSKNITMHLNLFDDLINIVYEDDGIGIPVKAGVSGIGLSNIESRVSIMRGAIQFESSKIGFSCIIDIPVNKE